MINQIKKSKLFSDYILLWVFVALILIGIISKDVFLSQGNINSLITGRISVGMIAVAMTICMAAGEMDISLGYMMGSCIMVAAWAGSKGAAPGVVLLITLLAGIFYGAMNGFFAIVLKIPSTIVTLGSGMIFYSISMWTNNSKSITGILPKAVTMLFKTKLLNLLPSV